MGIHSDVTVNTKNANMTVNRFDAPLAQLEVELERARVRRRATQDAKDYASHQRNESVTLFSSETTAEKRHPVQRAPSRLYRTVLPASSDHRAKYCCPNTCIGPEFVVNSSNFAKHLRMTDLKHLSQIRRVTVILLNGCKLKVSCNANSMTVGELLEVVVDSENIEDNFTLGLAVLSGGDFVFPPKDFKLSKVAPGGFWAECRRPHSAALASLLEPFGGHPPLTMYMRTKFFLPSLRGIRSWNLKHQLYLQLRRSLLEQQLHCNNHSQLLNLMGYALQAEFGDFTEKEHGCGDYFLVEHYMPEGETSEDCALKQELQSAHRERIGLDPGRAEEMFIALAQEMAEYGTHFYSASYSQKSGKDTPIWLAITANGVSLHEWQLGSEPRQALQTYLWKDIRKLSYSRQQFCLQPTCGKRVKLRMDLHKSYFTFRLATSHHQFFLKFRSELCSLQSVAAEFGVPVRKSNLSFVENLDVPETCNKESSPDVKAVLGAVLGPVRSRQIVKLPSPPSSMCKLNQIARIMGAAAAGNAKNIEEMQNKENEQPPWSSRHQRGSYESISVLNDLRQDSQRLPIFPLSKNSSVSPASTISRTSIHTCLGVTGCENRTPNFPRRSGVRMGTRAFSLGNSVQTLTSSTEHYRTLSAGATPCGTCTPSEYSAPSSPLAEAYVINSSIQSGDENFHLDSHESISESLAEKMGKISFDDERVLRTVRLQRDRLGSFGIEITESDDGAVYIQSVQRGGAAAHLGSIFRGDRLVAVDGQCLLNRRYDEALRLLRASGEEVELVLSQAAGTQQKNTSFVPRLLYEAVRLDECNIEKTPLEETYLRDIRYRTEECPTSEFVMMRKPLPQPTRQSPPRWTAHKKYPAPKPPQFRITYGIAPVPEDSTDALDRTV